MRPKLVVNDPTLRRPTIRQISATERSVVRSSDAARSSRRVSRYWCGVSPNSRRNSRLKWAGESRAAFASCGHVERLEVARVHQVLGAEQVPGGCDRLHRRAYRRTTGTSSFSDSPSMWANTSIQSSRPEPRSFLRSSSSIW